MNPYLEDDDFTEGLSAVLKATAYVDGDGYGGWAGHSYEFKCDVFEFHPYLWDYLHGDGEECTCAGECPDETPQFRHYATGLEITWYKYLGRGMKSNKEMKALEFYRDVVVDCLEALKKMHEENND